MSGPSNPIAAAFAATPWWMLAIRSFDAIEVHPCCAVGVAAGIEIVETCEPADARFWSVYGHCVTGGLECFADFPTAAAAEDFAAQLRRTYPHLAGEVPPRRHFDRFEDAASVQPLRRQLAVFSEDVRQHGGFLRRDGGLPDGQEPKIVRVDGVGGEPLWWREGDGGCPADAAHHAQALLARHANGQHGFFARAGSFGTEPGFRRQDEGDCQFPCHEAGNEGQHPLALIGVIGIEAGEDQEVAVWGEDAPGRDQFVAVANDREAAFQIGQHQVTERHRCTFPVRAPSGWRRDEGKVFRVPHIE